MIWFRKNVIVIGIGVETDRMGNFFHLHSSIYTPKDLIKKFGNVYANASEKALETNYCLTAFRYFVNYFQYGFVINFKIEAFPWKTHQQF